MNKERDFKKFISLIIDLPSDYKITISDNHYITNAKLNIEY